MQRLFVLLGLLVLIVCGASFWSHYQYANAPLRIDSLPVKATIPKGAGVRGAAVALTQAGIHVPQRLFRVAARLRGDGAKLKAGTYRFTQSLTLRELIDRLVAGDVLLEEVRFIEGWTVAQIRQELARNNALKHDTAELSDAAVLARLQIEVGHPEGQFFPSTYHFTEGTSELEVLRQASRLMQKVLEEAWATRPEDSPLSTPYEALILASIIEKETSSDADRGKVAGVLTNRLRKGMLLQSDPTTIYGLGEKFDGNLRKRDLQADTPYNTYKRKGLPPSPIAAPGQASIVAAIRPEQTDAMYFVARGDGSSEFSRTLAEHNRAVAKYQLKRKRR